MNIILITGSGSGIGYETAVSLKAQGHKIYGGIRSQQAADKLRQNGIIPIKLDVTNEIECKQAVEFIIENEKRLDVLINNAGYGLFGAVEDIEISEAMYQLDVNLFGMARLIQMVLPFMRGQQGGRIINISSVGGRVVSYMGAWYHASKYAVEALSDALRMEVSDFGIDVILIEPGGTKTNWWETAVKNMKLRSTGGVYEKAAEKAADGMMKLYSSTLMSKPAVISKAIVKAVHAKNPKARYIVGFGSRSLLFLHFILPVRWYDWLAKHVI
ncbi:oxidoreductase [Dielma fastidiosa]|uniref:oxidoreductase n=1 Tax=Dielma fastidiosa TaxID=1034346 RepID=UPI000EB8B2A9|nr:oxidoreductase [Dielma fastidiosa]HAH95176.1 short-chain dehydrogenase/reductase [Dielma fastidiosa]